MKKITKTIGYISIAFALWHTPQGKAITVTELQEDLVRWHEASVKNLKNLFANTNNVLQQEQERSLLEKIEGTHAGNLKVCQDICQGSYENNENVMNIETIDFTPTFPETSFSRYQKEKWETWRKNKKGYPLDAFSKELSEDELRGRCIDIKKIKDLGITSVREITFDSVLKSDFFDASQRELAQTWLSDEQELKKAIKNYVAQCTFWDRDFFEELTVKSTSFNKKTFGKDTCIVKYPSLRFLKPANESMVPELRKNTESALAGMLSHKGKKEKLILLLLLDEKTPKNAKLKWRYHNEQREPLGTYWGEDNLFSFINDDYGIKTLSHEIGHFLQQHLGVRQSFEDYQTLFAKKLLLLENDYPEKDIFKMPPYIQYALNRFYDHENIETETKYTPNLEQLLKKTCFEYFQLTARWKRHCEISNMLGVYFKGQTLYINTLSDFPEYDVIFYGHNCKINTKSIEKIYSELSDEKTKEAFENVRETAYKKPVPTDMLNLLCCLHKQHTKSKDIVCFSDYADRDALKKAVEDLYGDFLKKP